MEIIELRKRYYFAEEREGDLKDTQRNTQKHLYGTLFEPIFCSGALNGLLLVLFGTNLHYIWCKCSIITKNIYAGTAPSKDAILDKFSEQQKHIKAAYFNAQLALF